MNEVSILYNAEILDISSGVYAEGDLRIDDGVITEIGKNLPRPARASVIDARGRYLIPGLIDCHVHLNAESADLGSNARTSPTLQAAHASQAMSSMLSRGFTTVRDVGGADYGLAEAQRRGLFVGPRVKFGGPALSQTGGHGDFRGPGDDAEPICRHGIGRVVDGVDGVRAAVRDEVRKGADHIKIMASGGAASPTDRVDSTQFSEEEIRAAVEEATAANRYVTAHAYTARAVNRCLNYGVRGIEHGNFIDEESIRLFNSTEAFLVPTLVTYWALQREGRENGQSTESARKVDVILEAGLGALERATMGGVNIVYGSDLLGRMQRHQNKEFEIRAEVQSPLEILTSATSTAARLIEEEERVGRLEVGMVADLIMLDEDPLEKISVLANPHDHINLVMQAGTVVKN
ncbi:metal-dependent hydrolase family protein [Rothia santali]|uniref:metal-dependent hydrolase family protein n=1 Tax=Rothia santali TaxID=2949643 RepID=UPI0028155686|nr:amidohydrolase family protein [Rothia santali]